MCTYLWGGAIKIGARPFWGRGLFVLWFQISTLATRNGLPLSYIYHVFCTHYSVGYCTVRLNTVVFIVIWFFFLNTLSVCFFNLFYLPYTLVWDFCFQLPNTFVILLKQTLWHEVLWTWDVLNLILKSYFNSDTEVLSCTLNRKIKTLQWHNMKNYIINADCRN